MTGEGEEVQREATIAEKDLQPEDHTAETWRKANATATKEGDLETVTTDDQEDLHLDPTQEIESLFQKNQKGKKKFIHISKKGRSISTKTERRYSGMASNG